MTWAQTLFATHISQGFAFLVYLFTVMSKIRKVKLKKNLELSGVLVCYYFADPEKKMQETTPLASFSLNYNNNASFSSRN